MRISDWSSDVCSSDLELPALGIALENGNVRLDALADGTARITGSVRSASPDSATEAGILRVDGSLGWRGDQVPLVLRLHGDEVLVSNTRDLRAVASPDLTVRYAAGQPLNVTGEVTELGRAPCRERVCQYV